MPSLAQKWLKEGEQKGLEKGIEKKQIEVVKNLFNMGSSIGFIAKATSLTIEQVEKIVDSIKKDLH